MTNSEESEKENKRWNSAKTEFAQSLERTQQQLDLVWAAIGLDDEQIERRVFRVFEILRELTTEMLSQERALLKHLERNVVDCQTRLRILYTELHEDYEPPILAGTLLTRESELKKLVNSLESRKKKALLEWNRLRKLQTSISEKIGEETQNVEIRGTPTREQVEKLTESIVTLEKEFKNRHAKFLIVKTEIKNLLESMDISITQKSDENLKIDNPQNTLKPIIIKMSNSNKSLTINTTDFCSKKAEKTSNDDKIIDNEKIKNLDKNISTPIEDKEFFNSPTKINNENSSKKNLPKPVNSKIIQHFKEVNDIGKLENKRDNNLEFMKNKEGVNSRVKSPTFKDGNSKINDPELIKMLGVLEDLIGQNVVLSLKNLRTLNDYKDKLNAKFSEIKTKIDRLWVSVEFMWNLLEVPVTYCENFKNSNTKYSENVLKSLRFEDSRLKNIRRQNLSEYIPKLKDRLIGLWNKCRFGPHKREQFLLIFGDKISEESLLAHEEALLGAHSYYEENEKILNLIEKRDDMWETFRKLELGQSSVDKYQNRGGALLKEERVRRTVSKEIPKIEAEINELIEEYVRKNGNDFLVDDIQFKEYVSLQMESLKSEKDERRRVRLNSRTILETPQKRVNNTLLSSRLNSTTNKSRVCVTETCNRTKKLDPILRFTPIKRRSSLIWPSEESFVARNSRGREILKNRDLKKNDDMMENILNDKENDVLNESNKQNISTNVAIVTPVITSNNVKNSEKSPKVKTPIQKFKVWKL